MIHLLMGAVLLGRLDVSATEQVPVMLAPPTQVRFDSVDYKNIVRWTPPNTSHPLLYYIQWKIYGEPEWLDVDGCQGTQKLQCDLSAVTSEPREWYYARVHVSSLPSSKSAWALSPRFSPRWDTTISPPVLRLNFTKRGVVVSVRSSKALVRKMQSSLHYKIFLTHASEQEDVFEMQCCSNKLNLTELKHKERYCLQAQTTIPHQAKRSTRSPAKCFTVHRYDRARLLEARDA